MKEVVVFGVFDFLHPGHLYFLKQAKKYGDHLTAVVTRDARARIEKNRRPFFNERERLLMVGALRPVDRAILGDKVGEWKILKRLKPDVVCVGYDQNVGWIKQRKLRKMPRVFRIKMLTSKKYQSSVLWKKKLILMRLCTHNITVRRRIRASYGKVRRDAILCCRVCVP